MAFTTASLLFLGGLFIAVPIVLHFILRRQPRKIEFPALRFLQQQQETNQRSLKMRHWLLLLLRCLAVLAIAAALARPRVASALVGDWVLAALLAFLFAVVAAAWLAAFMMRRGMVLLVSLGVVALLLFLGLGGVTAVALSRGSDMPLADQDAPVAAMIVCDTSPRMLYRLANETRIEQARGMAAQLLRQLPKESQVAVVDSRPVPATMSIDMGAARKAIETLEVTNVPQALADTVADAIDLARKSELTRREIYIFTDLTTAAWNPESAALLKRRLAEEFEHDVQLYLIDVGAVDPQNFALGEVRLSPEVIAGNSELTIESDLSSTIAGERSVELTLEKAGAEMPVIVDGVPQLPPTEPRGSDRLTFSEAGRQALNFTIRGLETGVHHGYLRIIGSDGLVIDDERSFTVEVADAWPVLLVEGPGADGEYLTNALAPYEFRQQGEERFHVDRTPQAEFDRQPLDQYRAIWLVDPGPLSKQQWQKLRDYVAGGGGLAIALGRNAQPMAAFNEPAAQEVLPGKLRWQSRAGTRLVYLSPRSYDHPILSLMRDVGSTVPWQEYPVETWWELQGDINGDTIIPYSTGHAALVERGIGRGRVMLLTTPVSDPAHQAGRTPWNYLPTNPSPWPFVVLVNEMTLQLVGSGEAKLNYLVGQTATLPLTGENPPQRWQLFTPRGQWQEIAAAGDEIRVPFADLPGVYRLRDIDGGGMRLGFSVNLPASASILTRADRSQINSILGEDRYQLARNLEEIEIGVRESRQGRDFYPFLIAMLVLVLAAEHVLGNRFYKPTPKAAGHVELPPAETTRRIPRLPGWAMPWKRSA